MDDYDLKETFADIEDAIEAVYAYLRDDPKSQYANYNIRDLNGDVVWSNDAWQDIQKPGKIQFLPPKDVAEATGDRKFDNMMGRIQDPYAELTKNRDKYEYALDTLTDNVIPKFLGKMWDQNVSCVTNDANNNTIVDPRFLQAYVKFSTQAVKTFLQRRKFNPNDNNLVAKVRHDFDHMADQMPGVEGVLGEFMKDFTMFRPGELDVLSRSGAMNLNMPGNKK